MTHDIHSYSDTSPPPPHTHTHFNHPCHGLAFEFRVNSTWCNYVRVFLEQIPVTFSNFGGGKNRKLCHRIRGSVSDTLCTLLMSFTFDPFLLRHPFTQHIYRIVLESLSTLTVCRSIFKKIKI